MNWKFWTWFWKTSQNKLARDFATRLDTLTFQVADRGKAVTQSIWEIQSRQRLTEEQYALELDRQRRLMGKVYSKALALQRGTEDAITARVSFRKAHPTLPQTDAAAIVLQLMEENTEIVCECGRDYTANWSRCLRCGKETFPALVEELEEWL